MPATATGSRFTASRQFRAAGALLLILAFVGGSGYTVYWLLMGKPVLAGPRTHDFGRVAFAGEPITLTHTFELVNRHRRVVEIAGVRTSCGCTVATPSADTLEPGQTLRIDAKLTVKRDGRTTQGIYIHYPSGDMDALHLKAWAVRTELLFARSPSWKAGDQPVEEPIFLLDYDSSNTPPAPRITPPAGIRATFTGWTQQIKRRRAKGWPAKWEGGIRVERTGEFSGGTMRIEVGDDRSLTITLKEKS